MNKMIILRRTAIISLAAFGIIYGLYQMYTGLQ